MNKAPSTRDLHESSVSTEWRDSSTSVCTAFSDSSLPSPPELAGKGNKSVHHLAFDSLCFSSGDDAAIAALLSDGTTTTSTFAPVPSTFSPSPLSSSPSLRFCDPSLLYSPSSHRQPPASSKFCLSATSISTSTSTSDSILPNSARGPWWHRALCVLWIGAKMCVMFTLMAVLWLVLALPTIDQQLWTLFYFVCQYCALSKEEEASRRRAATHHRHHQASVFQIREDDTSDGEGEGETATKPRLSGSQELKKSEEGESIDDEEEEEEREGAASSVETAKSKTKPKKRVRFSD